MKRLFSVRRRRTHIVDLMIQRSTDPAVDGYRVSAATNFDASFTTIIDTVFGYRDPNVNQNVIESQSTDDVRVVFDPDTYTGATGIEDASSFWLQVSYLDGGTPVLTGAPTLVVPDLLHWGVSIVTVAGTAPSTELQLDFPKLMEDFKFTNEDGANNLLVGTEEGGPKLALLPLVGPQSLTFSASAGALYFQGDGAPVAFSGTFSLAFPQ